MPQASGTSGRWLTRRVFRASVASTVVRRTEARELPGRQRIVEIVLPDPLTGKSGRAGRTPRLTLKALVGMFALHCKVICE